MSSERDYGTEIESDEFSSVLEPTRQLRLALDVLWGSLPSHIETGTIEKALQDLHEWLCGEELRVLRTFGFNRQYTIIRPLNMMNLPDAKTLGKIVSAIHMLDDLGLIARPGTNESRFGTVPDE